MTSYVHPNIVLKKLQQFCQNPLYISANFFIKNQIGKISQNSQMQVKHWFWIENYWKWHQWRKFWQIRKIARRRQHKYINTKPPTCKTNYW
jgi:hypothetical protein